VNLAYEYTNKTNYQLPVRALKGDKNNPYAHAKTQSTDLSKATSKAKASMKHEAFKREAK
jgi:hypothetical protein